MIKIIILVISLLFSSLLLSQSKNTPMNNKVIEKKMVLQDEKFQSFKDNEWTYIVRHNTYSDGSQTFTLVSLWSEREKPLEIVIIDPYKIDDIKFKTANKKLLVNYPSKNILKRSEDRNILYFQKGWGVHIKDTKEFSEDDILKDSSRLLEKTENLCQEKDEILAFARINSPLKVQLRDLVPEKHLKIEDNKKWFHKGKFVCLKINKKL